MATAKQLAALKKARAARKKKSSKTTKKRVTGNRYVVFTKGGKGTRYYLQKKGNAWIWDSQIPAGMTKEVAEKTGRREFTKIKDRVPCGYGLYMVKKR